MRKRSTAKTNDRKFKTEKEPAIEPKYPPQDELKKKVFEFRILAAIFLLLLLLLLLLLSLVSFRLAHSMHTPSCVQKGEKVIHTTADLKEFYAGTTHRISPKKVWRI